MAGLLLDTAKELGAAALSDSYFVYRKINPNGDFDSGFIYKVLGFPVNMFTALFAIGRLPGWIAQCKKDGALHPHRPATPALHRRSQAPRSRPQQIEKVSVTASSFCRQETTVKPRGGD